MLESRQKRSEGHVAAPKPFGGDTLLGIGMAMMLISPVDNLENPWRSHFPGG
jgi:hypothetical protein